MSYLRLAPYTPDARVAPETAKQDRLSLVLDHISIGPADDFSLMAFFEALCVEWSPEGAPSDRWFRRHRSTDPTRPILLIQQGGSGRGNRAGRPLLTGEMRVRFGSTSPLGSTRLISLNLQLNPTRFVHHQPPAHWIERRLQHPSQWQLPPPIMHSSVPKLDDLDESSLDRNDNLLLGRVAHSFGSASAWPLHLRRYLEGALTGLENALTNAARVANIELIWQPHLNLRKMETYWEFRVASPLIWTRQVAPALMALSPRAGMRDYPTGFAVDERDSNSRRIRVMLSTGVGLRLYAKTNHRVRFEIEHDLVESASVLGTAHTSRDPYALLGWLQQGADDAALRLNDVLAQLARVGSRRGVQMTVTQLLVAILYVVRDRNAAEEIVQMFVANQSITVPTGSRLRRQIQLLERNGIVERLGRRSQQFILSERFHDARLRLEALEGIGLLRG